MHNKSIGSGWYLPVLVVCGMAVCLLLGSFAVAAQTPGTGKKAPDFTLSTPAGEQVTLGRLNSKGAVVLVVLRGYPGYQCPFCEKQAHEFIANGAAFAAKNARVLLVYPGPPAELDMKAKEFLTNQANMPENVQLVVDPDYKVTNLYGLRWDAPNETAYPATFVLDAKGTIVFEKVSHQHGDRTAAKDVLSQVPGN